MRHLKKLLLLISVILVSCTGQQKVNTTNKKQVNSKKSRFELLESFFKDLKNDTLFVFSSFDMENLAKELQGTRLNKAQIALFPSEINAYGEEFAACYKFPVDEQSYCFVLRSQGEFDATSIKLLLFNLEKDDFTDFTYLADAMGDAGETYTYNSCIFKNREKQIWVLKSTLQAYSDPDSEDPAEYKSYSYSLVQIGNSKIDTLSTDSSFINQQFPALIQKLSRF